MCEYCGCLDVPAIAALTSEHDDLRAVARDAACAARAGDQQAAIAAVRRLLTLLEPHTEVEERALFPAMAAEFAEHVASLEADHSSIGVALADLADGGDWSAGWAERLDAALAHLFEHILREQDGLFPAALSVLTPAQWEVLQEVRAEVASRDRAAVT